ncbi:MAG TPA: filamentous hemagglutinin N-terminal domain-containing protein, partial [Xanthomonadaceae bacterium]|nr:filamentous hemagglutinin N-terminal domain-containing protein [Xanthomonadaceae bacterium]
MNHVYRIVWSHARQAWVVVCEFARGRGKSGGGKRRTAAEATTRATLVLAGIGLLPLHAWAGERSHVFTAPVAPHEVSAPVAVPAIRRSPATPPAPVVAPDARPTGGTVVAGDGSIVSSGNVTTITQGSDVLSLTWNSFDIGAGSTVTFVQPDALSIAVNRVLGTDASQILGRLDANGQVFLINPYGVVFGEGAQVNVGGLVASTLDLDDDSFGSETLRFSGDSSAAVINRGTLTAASGGYVALLGHNVSNQGTIRAQLGSVALGAGFAVTLRMDGQQLVDMQVERSALEALVENRELIVADGGQVLMTAGARDSLLASVVNNTGVVQARTVGERDGRIVLLGGMEAGTTHVDGLLDASAPEGGDGGFIETSAAHVQVADSARITTLAADGDTGTWLIDPQDYTVAATGGDITGATLSANLATTDIEIQSASGATAGSGDIHVDDAVTWDADTTLTLTASNDININADLTATGDNAGLVLNPDTANGADAASGSGTYSLNRGARITLSGLNPYLSIGGNVYTVINSLGVAGDTSGETLQGIAGDLAGYYALGSDIDASDTAAWNGGAGFDPLGPGAVGFSGILDGLGHGISGLWIDSLASNVGLFGTVDSTGEVRNLVLAGGTVTTSGAAFGMGSLAGRNLGLIENVRSSADVNEASAGVTNIGGLVGENFLGTIRDAHATGDVTSVSIANVGGLVGSSVGVAGLIEEASASGAISGGASANVGGLVGANRSGATIRNAYASGSVEAGSSGVAGGLVGLNHSNFGNTTTISNSYATGDVTGGRSVGGLVGQNSSSSISNAYATGAVSSTEAFARVGGIAGSNGSGATIQNVHASGAITGTYAPWTHGIVGVNQGAITNARWDTERTTMLTGAGGGATTNVVGLIHAQMFDSA